MEKTTCPYCGHITFLEYVEGSARFSDREHRAEAAYQCANCDRMLIGGRINADLQGIDERGLPIPGMHLEPATPPQFVAQALLGREAYWEPVTATGKSFPDVPASVSGAASEAHTCFSIGSYRGAIMLARAVIEAAAKSKDIAGRDLRAKIDGLAEAQYLSPQVAASAHEVRYLGNDMAHGDFVSLTVEADDVIDVLEIMDDVLESVYAVPTRLQRRREARATRKVGGVAAETEQ